MKSSKLKIDQWASTADQELGLFKYFKMGSLEEQQESITHESERVKELRAVYQERQLHASAIRDKHKQDKACKRKQRQQVQEKMVSNILTVIWNNV